MKTVMAENNVADSVNARYTAVITTEIHSLLAPNRKT